MEYKLFSFQIVEDCPDIFMLLVSIMVWEHIFESFHILWPRIWSISVSAPRAPKGMFTLLLGPVGWWCCSNLLCSSWLPSACSSVPERGVLKSWPISPFSSVWFCFVFWSAGMRWLFKIVTASWWNDTFIITQSLSSSLVMSFLWNLLWCHSNPGFLWPAISTGHPFLSLVSLELRCFSCRLYIVGPWYFIQGDNLWLN